MSQFLMPMIAPFISKGRNADCAGRSAFAFSAFCQKPFGWPLIGCSLLG